MLPINRPATIVTTSGATIRGRRVNEDTFSVQLVDDRERLVTVVKSDIKTMELAKAVADAVGGAKTLSPDEVADLVAYLLSLRGVPMSRPSIPGADAAGPLSRPVRSSSTRR